MIRNPRALRTGTFRTADSAQRVAVKVHIARHWNPKSARGMLRKHAAYLQREGVGIDGKSGVGYSASEYNISLKDEVAGWTNDRHHFRWIVSAENAAEIPSLTQYTRDLMGQVEKDLGTKLDWLAVNHFNSGTFHTHVLIRGTDDRGQDLVIARDYLSYSLRNRARSRATELLGERTPLEIQRALRLEVQASSFTSLDRHIISKADKEGRLLRRNLGKKGRYDVEQSLLIDRIAQLKKMGLVEVVGRHEWRISSDTVVKLRELGRRGDVIRSLHRGVKLDTNNLIIHGPNAKSLSQSITGTIVARGRPDELRDEFYVVVKDKSSQLHYVPHLREREVKQLPKGCQCQMLASPKRGVVVYPSRQSRSPNTKTNQLKAIQNPANPKSPSFDKIYIEDLRDTGRLLELYRQAVNRKLMDSSTQSLHRFVGAAERGLEKGEKSPVGLFRWIVDEKQYDRISQAQEERATRRLKEFKRGKTTREPLLTRPEVKLSDDAKRVRAFELTLRRDGYRGDAFKLLNHKQPEWTRDRWDRAKADLEQNHLSQKIKSSGAARLSIRHQPPQKINRAMLSRALGVASNSKINLADEREIGD